MTLSTAQPAMAPADDAPPRGAIPTAPEPPPRPHTHPDAGRTSGSAGDPSGAAWLVAQALVADRGEPRQWRAAPIRDGLASAIIDAVMSARVSTSTVDATVLRYESRYGRGGPAALAASFADLGADGWRATIGTNHRTHASTSAPYKAAVIDRAARLMRDEGVVDQEALWERAQDAALRAAWCALPGQSSGASWRHLLLVSGYTEPLVCPLTLRYLRRVLGRAAATMDPAALVLAAADILDVGVAEADHQLWRAAVTPSAGRGRPKDASEDEAPTPGTSPTHGHDT